MEKKEGEVGKVRGSGVGEVWKNEGREIERGDVGEVIGSE